MFSKKREKKTKQKKKPNYKEVENQEIPDCAAPKVTSSFLSWTTIELSVRIRELDRRHKNLCPQIGFVTRFLNEVSPEIKNKWKSTTEVLPRKFKWKKTQPRILRKRNLKKTRNSKNSETFRKNRKRKEKYTNSKNFVSRTFSQRSFPQIVRKICLTLSFLSFYFSFLLYYRTLHSYSLIWAVCHLFPQQRWRTHTNNQYRPGEPRDLRKTTSA